jgi:4-hydroxythreonine-4-phosphate dehydrogenase
MPEQPTICLTIGDSTGIGPEITAKFLQTEPKARLLVLGDIPHLEKTAEQLRINLPQSEHIQYENHAARQPGAVAYASLEAAVSKIYQGEASILVTGPISKDHLQEAGIAFTGHTEILQYLARKLYNRNYQSDMLFVYQQFRMLLLTRHVALRKVSEELSIPHIQQSLGNLIAFLKAHCGIEKPRLCVLGVNPHAGELEGGGEEERILEPALRLTSSKYDLEIDPPKPADAVFRHFDVNNLLYDAYVAAYHDQGLIPFKMVAGLNAVNVTIGLPFLRTSVSHGTAPDIAGQGIADPSSLQAAYDMALSLMQNP